MLSQKRIKIAKFCVIIAAFYVILMLSLSRTASAASITVTGPSSIAESTSGGATTFKGESRIISEKLTLKITASSTVTEETNAWISFTFNVVGDCGLLGGKGTTELLPGPGGGTIPVNVGNTSGNSSDIWLYPLYDPEYTGTRTCTLTFTNNAASSTNTEVASLYGGVTIPSYTLKIFDAQTAPKTESTPTSTPKTTETTSPTPVKNVTDTPAPKPETPKTKLVDTTGKELILEDGQEKHTFSSKDPIIISGTTVPNGVVKLYIFSEPQEATVTADDEGNWSYTVARIEPGDHRVEAEVTDPETGETSERAEVLAFSVMEDEELAALEQTDNSYVEPVAQTEGNSLPLPVIVGSIVVIAIAGAVVGYIFWRKKHTSVPVDTSGAQ